MEEKSKHLRATMDYHRREMQKAQREWNECVGRVPLTLEPGQTELVCVDEHSKVRWMHCVELCADPFHRPFPFLIYRPNVNRTSHGTGKRRTCTGERSLR